MSRADCKNDKTSKVTIDLVDNSPYHLIGAFDGPEDTPYEGGHYQVVSIDVFHNLVLASHLERP